jgi:hypothetical protein
MSTIPGVTATTQVVNNNPKGNASAVGAFVGASDQGNLMYVYEFTTYTQASSALGTSTTNGSLITMIGQAFLNGANRVIAVTASTSGAVTPLGYSQALDLLLKEDNIDYVVIEGTDATSQGYLKTHVQNAVAEGKYRRGYCGKANGTSIGTYASSAGTLASDRVFLVGPNYLDNTGAPMSGGVTAATYAALAESEPDPAKPRTGMIAQGVSGIETKLLSSDYDILHNGGVATTKSIGGETGIMRYLTTYTGTSGIKEGTIALERDYVANHLKSKLEAEFRRSKVTGNTLKQIEASILGQLKGWQKQEIVNPDQKISATAIIDDIDPSKVNVDVQYWAVYPLNFIALTLTLNI